MTSWTTMGYQLGLRSIEAAYRASKNAFEQELSRTEAKWRSLAIVPDDEDEPHIDQYRDHLSDQAFDAEQGLRLIREAFALTLYHYWEKEMYLHLHSEVRQARSHSQIMEIVVKDGRIKPHEAGLTRLHLIANAVKHGKGKPLFDEEPNLFSDEAKQLKADDRHGWHLFLQLTDDDVLRGIEAVRASGPGQDWQDDSPEFEDGT